MGQGLKAAVIVGSVAVIFAVFFIGLGGARVPLLISFVLAYFFFPAIRRLEKRGISRDKSIASVFVFIALICLVSLLLLVPKVINESKLFLQELPKTSVAAAAKLENLARALGFELEISKEVLQSFLQEHSDSLSAEFLQNVTSALKQGLSGFVGSVLFILNFLLVPLFFYYIVSHFEGISKEIRGLLPLPWRPTMSKYVELSNRVLNGYLRGQTSVALILAVLYGLGLWAIGLKSGFFIGIATGLFSIIPYVGSILGFVTAMTVALADFTGFGMLIAIGVVFAVVQGLEGFVITPKLVGDKVGIGVLTAMLALVVGGNLFGLIGMVLAIPIAAILQEILRDLKVSYKALPFYTGKD